jgi:hypothetical protein
MKSVMVSRTDGSGGCESRVTEWRIRAAHPIRHPQPAIRNGCCSILVAVWLVLTAAPGAHGARKAEFNVDFFCGWDGYYRPMEWTPVDIQIGSDLKEPFSGSFTASARQDEQNTLNIIHNFVLTPDQPVVLPLVTKFAFGTDKCDLAIRDERGRTWWQSAINMWDPATRNRLLRVVQNQDLLIGLVGQGQFGLLRLPQETTSLSDRGPGKVYLGNLVPRHVPWDWTGFASLDVFVLCDPDWSLFQRQQMKAVCDWVLNGGTVLLVLGRHPLPPDSPLNDILPFRVGEPRQVTIPAEVLTEWDLNASHPSTVTAWPLFTKPTALLTKKTELPGGGYLYGAGCVGFGRVAVLGFGPSGLGEEQTGRSAAFWTRHITACVGDWSVAPGGPDSSRVPGRASPVARGRGIVLNRDAPTQDNRPGYNENLYRISVAQGASNRVMEHLYQLRQMRPLSIWWVILTLTALAVLLGPVDYLVLKRLDKLPYTWLTSTGWIVIFTVGAYYGVQWIRGGAMELRAVSVLDGVADSNCAWATCYTGLFAPRSDDYRLDGLTPNQWWSGITPNQEELYLYRAEPALRQIYCLQVDGGNLPVSVPVNIWTVQTLLSEWAPGQMPFTATVERRGNRLVVEINNRSDSAIPGGFVLLENACADLGPVPAHATQRLEVATRPFEAWQDQNTYVRPRGGRPDSAWASRSIPRYPPSPFFMGGVDSAFFAQGSVDRTLAMHTYLHFGAAVVCVAFADAPAPLRIKNYSYKTDHIQLARQLVFIRRE